MPGPDGLEVLRYCLAEQPTTQVVLLTAHGTVESAVEAMKLGAFDYLQKPISGLEELRLLVARAAERKSLLTGKKRSDRGRNTTPRLSYGDPAMKPVVSALEKVAPTEANVLLTGESGTGKEVAARTVHNASARKDGPFVALNCAAVTDTLIESELFGHEKGAFTGATRAREGRIELATGGTLFLDEIGELKPELQAKLLRVLQEGEYERVGGSRTYRADVRWVAATNRDLESQIAEGSFREDLFHRIAVFPIELPPLRQRRADIRPMAATLLGNVAADLGRPGLSLSEDALTQLEKADWPGNARELRNTLERAAILSEGEVIERDALLLRTRPTTSLSESSGGNSAPQALADVEKMAIEQALAQSQGNRREAAEILGIGLRTLYDKLKKYELN